MSGDDGDFLSRWSRRKRAAGAGPAPEPEAARLSEAPAPEPQVDARADTEEKSDAEILESLGLKDPDLLGPGDDFRAFMQAAVPDHLRRRALRRLWVSNPVLANLDGLNDYDGDFRGGSVGPGLLKTAYQVGRGIVREIAEPPQATDVADVADVAAHPDAPLDAEENSAFAESGEISRFEQNAKADAAEDSNSTSAGRRRMRFRYES